MMSKRPALLLLASVGLNLVLVGLLAGLWLNVGKHDRARPPHSGGIERAELTPETRHAVREAYRSARATAADARERHEQARAVLHETLIASSFDPDAARAAFRALRETEADVQLALQEGLIARMIEMSQEERTHLAERLRRRRPGRPRR